MPADVATSASRGKPLYLRYCAPCHGDTGEGNGPHAREFDPPPSDLVASGVRVSVKNLEVIIQTPHYSTRVMTERVTSGTREMPAWDQVLTPQEIDDVIAYVRALIQAHAEAQRG
jgi:mono/diheme cytochrome c family protein